MNHRIFERTLRPMVFRRACLFERHYTPQALLGIGRRPLNGTCLKDLGGGVFASSVVIFLSRFGVEGVARRTKPLFFYQG